MSNGIRRWVTFFPGHPEPVEAELMTPTVSHEPGNRYELADGTILTLKVVATEFWRAATVKDQEGNPLLVVKSQNFLTTIWPTPRKIN